VTETSDTSRGLSLALLVLLAWSFALRVWLGTPDLTSNRFWDERYGIENIHALVHEGQLRPGNGFHPGLSYLPQAALLAVSQGLHRLTGAPVFAVFDDQNHQMTPTGYLLCRFLQAVLGTLSIWLTFRIGSRIFSPRVGLLAAFLLAVIPWHLRQSVIYKPDILLVAVSLFAFDRALAAAARPDWRRFLVAGSAIGLALASKFNAGPIAFPLMTVALTGGGWRDRRAWGKLVLAGAASVAVFLLFTPYLVLDWDLYQKDFSRTLRDYEKKGERLGGSHLYVLWHGLQSLFSWSFHGPVIATIALLGIALLLIRALRGPRTGRPGTPEERLGPAMMASFVIGYALFYTWSTLNPSEHNWLPLMPFTAIAAAWLLLGVWERLATRLPLLRRPAVAGALLAVLALLLAQNVNGYTYRNTVPTTHELAGRYLEKQLRPLPGRTIVYERGEGNARVLRGRSGAFLQGTGRLDQLPPERIDQADALLFESARLDGQGGDFYRNLSASGGGEIVRFAPAPFRARGTGLAMVIQPWRQIGDLVPLTVVPQGSASTRRGRFEAHLPDDVRPGEVLSLEIILPGRWQAETFRQVQVQGKPIEWETGGLERRRRRLVTRRFQVADPNAPIVVVLSRPLRGKQEVKVRVRRWVR
jgi:hypothetical protein